MNALAERSTPTDHEREPSVQVCPTLALPASAARNLPRREVPGHGVIVRVPVRPCACGSARVILATDAGAMVRPASCDSCEAESALAEGEWRRFPADPRAMVKAQLDTLGRNAPELAEAISRALAEDLGPEPAPPPVTLGELRYLFDPGSLPLAEFRQALDRQSQGDFGGFGRLDSVDLSEADRFAPGLAPVGARNKMNVGRGSGPVRGRFPFPGKPGLVVDVLTVLGPAPSTFVRVSPAGSPCYGA